MGVKVAFGTDIEAFAVEYHCVHNDGRVRVRLDLVGAVREIDDPKLGKYSRLHMEGGMEDIEIREPFEEVSEAAFGEFEEVEFEEAEQEA